MNGDRRAAAEETHISVVLFAGDRVYKLLKPIATAFVDHSTTEDRLAAIRREIELNRRLAPDVYLGEADVVEAGEVVDRFLVMRRLPEDRRLAGLVADAGFDDCLRAVVKTVAAFHAGLEPLSDPRGPASLPFVQGLWEASIEEMAADMAHLGRSHEHEEVLHLAHGYLSGRDVLFEERIRDGHQRDGHGDLLAQDIFCLDDGPRILDCLAFRDDLRVSDVLNDIGFLAMDLERVAGPDAGARVIDLYREFTDEHHPSSLAHHFIAYRALVRSKVAGIRAGQGDPDSWRRAEQLHRMAVNHLRLGEVRAVLVGGAPGTGKTTVAQAVADRFGWILLSSDEVRKDVAGLPRGGRAPAGLDHGLYEPRKVDETYEALLERAGHLMSRGESVVLDASWATERHRRWCRQLTERSGARVSAIECLLDPHIAAERVSKRTADTAEASDATPELATLLAARRDPWPEAQSLETHQSRAFVAEQVVGLLEPEPGG